MAISCIQSGQQPVRSPFVRGGAVRQQEQATARDRTADTVVISQKARELSKTQAWGNIREKNATGPSDAAVSDKTLPLEAYSMPGWMGDFIPKHVILDTKIGQSYLDSNSALRDRLSSREKADLAEYMETLMATYKEESERRGIETAEDYYHEVVLKGSPGLSEDIHQAVETRLVSDSRTMALMRQFDVGGSSSPSERPFPQGKTQKESFANHLEDQMAKAAEEPEDGRPNMFADDLETIKEKGFMAYVRDVEKEKLENIRKEILERMGLTEEDLANLPPNQRRMIEDIIAREIQVQITASSLKKNDHSDDREQSVEKVMAGIRPEFVFAEMVEALEKTDPA